MQSFHSHSLVHWQVKEGLNWTTSFQAHSQVTSISFVANVSTSSLCPLTACLVLLCLQRPFMHTLGVLGLRCASGQAGRGRLLYEPSVVNGCSSTFWMWLPVLWTSRLAHVCSCLGSSEDMCPASVFIFTVLSAISSIIIVLSFVLFLQNVEMYSE